MIMIIIIIMMITIKSTMIMVMIFVRMLIMMMVNLVKVDDVLVLHLSENVDLLLNVSHGHPPPGGLHPLLLDVPDHSNYSLHTHSSINTQAADSLHGHDYHTKDITIKV